jgi:hypothetical protein
MKKEFRVKSTQRKKIAKDYVLLFHPKILFLAEWGNVGPKLPGPGLILEVLFHIKTSPSFRFH